MKKLLFKFICLFFPLVILLPLNILYMRTNYWQDENDVRRIKTTPYNVQLGNVGSSHGQNSFKYDVVDNYCCANLGLSAQRHSMSYLVLKQYIDHMQKNAVLLIPISYCEITNCYDVYYKEQEPRYYRILSSELIPDYSVIKRIRFDLFPILSGGRNIGKIFNDAPEGDIFTLPSVSAKVNEQELPRIAEVKYSAWISPIVDKGEEGFIYNQQALSKIIDLCHEHHIKPVLITTPIIDVLNEYFDNHEGFFDTFYRFIDEVQEKYPDILYFDYSHDERFSPDHTLFIDSDHLNLWGAEKFTRIVVSDLENAGLLQKPQSSATNTDFAD